MIKRLIFSAFVLMCTLTGCSTALKTSTAADVDKWSDKQVEKWFRHSEWSNIVMDVALDKRSLAKECLNNPQDWHAAYTLLTSGALGSYKKGEQKVTERNLYANFQEYTTKDSKGRSFEHHHKMIDIQYIAEGSEIVEVTDLANAGVCRRPYKGDAEMFAGTDVFTKVVVNAGHCAIIFPGQPHKPGCSNGEKAPVGKVVIKIPVSVQ